MRGEKHRSTIESASFYIHFFHRYGHFSSAKVFQDFEERFSRVFRRLFAPRDKILFFQNFQKFLVGSVLKLDLSALTIEIFSVFCGKTRIGDNSGEKIEFSWKLERTAKNFVASGG